MRADPLLAVIVGPTASGKTALSLAIAERFAGEIVNCDSVALYRDFQIGTAKPSPAERARAPHHLLEIAAPNELMTAGEYARRARAVLEEIRQRGRMPIIVGGTGLYLRALLEGLSPGPQRSESLRRRLRARARAREMRGSWAPGTAPLSPASGSEWLHRMLGRLDAAAADRIHPNDLPKIIRAIEVCREARQPLTRVWESGREPLRGFRLLRLGLDPDRAALYTRINERAAAMFAAGLVEETAALIARYGEHARPLESMGYKQAGQLLRGQLDRAAALAAAQQAHRNYAKRQMTWFRREPEVAWLHGFGDDPGIQRQALALLEAQS